MYLLLTLSGPNAAYTQDPRVQLLDTSKDFIIQILNEYLTLQQISSICFTVLPAHTPFQLQEKIRET